MNAQTILKLIESVSPDDTAKLDEIDARADAFAKNHPFHQMAPDFDFALGGYWTDNPSGVARHKRIHPLKYTRSRDALKAIRPGGWWFSITPNDFDKFDVIGFRNKEIAVNATRTRFFPTEELAELHAIIQAIEYDRNQILDI